MIRSVIIDDEAKSRSLLRNLLITYCDNVEIVGEADTIQTGIKQIQESSPALVFLDIVLQNENGFDLLEKLNPIDFEVIFITAHDEYAINAIRVSALDYLLKPINIDELIQAVKKVEEKIKSESVNEVNKPLLNLIENQKSLNKSFHKIGVPTLTGLDFIPIEDIVVCKAEGNYTRINLIKKNILVTRTLKEFEDLLSEYNFLRIHRSYLINLNHINKYNRTHQLPDAQGDGGSVTLSNNLEIPVSREKRKTLLDLFSRPF